MRALIAKFPPALCALWARRSGPGPTGSGALGWASVLAALALGVAASLAVAEVGGDQATDAQSTTTSPSETTAAETQTETTTSQTQTTTSAPTDSQSSPKQSSPAPGGSGGRFIVVLKDSTSDPQTVAKEHGRRYGLVTDFVYTHAIKGYAARLSAQQLDQVRQDPAVQFVSADREVKAVGTEALASGDSAPTGVRRIEAATTTTVHQASTAAVAVIDTGINLTHPDLNAAAGKNCVRSNKSPNDDNGHGSHVAGTIAAKNNGSGVVGVAPNTKLYAVKVLNQSGSGTWSQVICGIDWVTTHAKDADKNIKVANMSLGGGGSDDQNCGNTNSDALHKAICRSTTAGVIYAVAAGNSAANEANSVPAAYNEALTVTAMSDSDGQPGHNGSAPSCRTGEADDKYASFSNFASTSSDEGHTIAAPGVCIRSTWKSGGYNTISGTSMATPHVTGSVALCLDSSVPSFGCAGKPPNEIIQRLLANAQSHTSSNQGYGFTGDPNNNPVSGKYFGYLAWDGGY